MPAYITSLGIANPAFRFEQSLISEFMMENAGMDHQERRKLQALYRASGIKSRYTILKDFGVKKEQWDFFNRKPGVAERMDVYRKKAPALSAQAVGACMEEHGNIAPKNFTHLITVSCTGMYAPGLDVDLVHLLDLNHSVKRFSINFMGCYAAFNGLKLADSICRADPEAKVLMVCVELCTLHYQDGKDDDTILANALFADGAAAAIVEGKPRGDKYFEIKSTFSDLVSDGHEEMTWSVSEQGFKMKLSSYVPELLRKGIAKLSSVLINRLSCRLSDLEIFAIHPGGRRILEIIEEELNLDRSDNKYAYEVLREYGNMSSATILFVLNKMLQNLKISDNNKKMLAMAFGPGLTLEAMTMEVFCKNESSVKKLIKTETYGHI